MTATPKLLTGGPLLNFYMRAVVLPHPITLEFCEWASVEHYFQASKGLYLRGSSVQKHAAYNAVESVRITRKPGDAKKVGRGLPLLLPLWNKAAFAHMFAAQLGKFAQHPDLAKMLLDTGSMKLVEHRPDPIWGDNMDGTGKNLCGRSLMLIRNMAKDWDIGDQKDE